MKDKHDMGTEDAFRRGRGRPRTRTPEEKAAQVASAMRAYRKRNAIRKAVFAAVAAAERTYRASVDKSVWRSLLNYEVIQNLPEREQPRYSWNDDVKGYTGKIDLLLDHLYQGLPVLDLSQL